MGFVVAYWLIPSLTAVAGEPEPVAMWNRYEYQQPHMGMLFRLVLYARSDALADRGAQMAFGRVAALNRVFSDYDSESELSRLCQHFDRATVASRDGLRPVPVSAELFEVLDRSTQLAHRTDGAFDATVGPLVQLWRRARKTGRFADDATLRAARARVGWQRIRLEHRSRSVAVLPGTGLDLGGIAVGYTIDDVLARLRDMGIEHALIDASGDIGCTKAPPGTDGWRVGIAALNDRGERITQYLRLSQQAVTTSGDASQFVEIDGRRYSHIVDPKTGIGLPGRMSVSVIAQDTTTADAVATAACVLGVDRGTRLVNTLPGCAGYFQYQPPGVTQDAVTHHATERWHQFTLPAPSK